MSTSLSREGIPYSSYRWPHVVFAVPFAIIFGIILILWRLTVRKVLPDTSTLPKNAIICFFHRDLFIGMMLMELYARFSNHGGWVLGVHHFISYVWSMETYLRGWHVWRFDPRNRNGLKEGIKAFLARPDTNTFRYATDSGGPYGTIRKSIIELSVASNRPVVINTIRASRYLMVKGHCIPLPFCLAKAHFSEPVSSQTLACLNPDEARDLLQKIADRQKTLD